MAPPSVIPILSPFGPAAGLLWNAGPAPPGETGAFSWFGAPEPPTRPAPGDPTTALTDGPC